MQQIFMMPSGQATEAFNTTAFIKGEAVSNYEADENTNFASVETTLAALAMPGLGLYNRSALYPRDIEDALPEPLTTDEERVVFRVVEGKSSLEGFGVVILQVTGKDKKPEYLHVIEDQKGSRMIVMGAGAIHDGFRETLAKNGVFYVARSDKDAVDKVNTLIADFAITRQHCDWQTAHHVIATIIKAFSAMTPLTDATGQHDRTIKAGSTVGGALASFGNEEPTVFTKICKPRPSAFENLPV